jgi:uncharacterized DUF497 family protein
MKTIEWNSEKNIINRVKHGLDFEDAIFVFYGQTVTFLDDRKDYGEIRYITLGQLSGREVVMVYTIRENSLRIISLRKANEREKKIYKERLKAP